MEKISSEIMKKLVTAQKNEVTEAAVYNNILRFVKDEKNRSIIKQIADVETMHANVWKSYTKIEAKPNKFKVWLYTNIVRFLGITFGLKLMEKGEREAVIDYEGLVPFIPQAKAIQKDEEEHEHQLIALINDKALDNLGSIVLGLNDALVELTGVLAGLTFGLQNGNMIASVGIITGISAAMSMAGSEYLSTKTEGGDTKPLTAATYTGIAYITTVILLIAPYLIFSNIYVALAACMTTAIIIIAVFNYYAAIAKDYSFKSRFLEMASISLGVAFISFIVGLVVKNIFGIDV